MEIELENKNERFNVQDLENYKSTLLTKIKELDKVQKSNGISLDINTRDRDLFIFYQYLLMEYEAKETKRDEEKDILKKFLLSISLKVQEASLKKRFKKVDLDDLMMIDYNLVECYKGMCNLDLWCSEKIDLLFSEVEEVEKTIQKRK